MGQIAITQLGLAGAAPTLVAAAAGGDAFVNDGKTLYRVTNGGASAVTVTFTAQQPCNQGVLHNDVVSVGAGQTLDIGPFPAARFNDANGNVDVTYSAVTSVTVGAVRV